MLRGAVSLMVAVTLTTACVEDRRIRPVGSADAAATVDALVNDNDGGVTPGQCDMTGVWIVAQVAFAVSIGAEQKAVNWMYHDITQTGDTFVITKSLNCGFRVTGTTTVTLPEDTLEALAINTSNSVGRSGTAKPTGDGSGCKVDLERTFNIRGVNAATFLTDHWAPGDPPKELSEFPELPANESEGMEDWDNDGFEGITLSTGLGNRYVGQRDWNEHHGVIPNADFETGQWGGEGVMGVVWDAEEKVSTQTDPLLQIGSSPTNPGYAFYVKVGSDLEIVTDGPRPVLETCRNVQRLALKIFPNP